jgi:16S rRNA (cytidine1402-2'-O)-methyltransferase
MPGTLYVVATPLGHLGDLTPRAATAFESARLIVAEDTRVTAKLLAHLELRRRLVSCHRDNETDRIDEVLRHLREGEDVALCSDAGTPAVSDPGARIVEAVHGAGLRVVPIAGPSAVSAALSASGFDAATYRFVGFLPRKGEPRRVMIGAIADAREPVVLFESPQRTGDTLADLVRACGDGRVAVVARELTKMHEEIVRASLGELAARFAAGVRGEVVIVVGPAPGAATMVLDDEAILAALARRPPSERLRDRADAVAVALGVPRRRVYQLAAKAPR